MQDIRIQFHQVLVETIKGKFSLIFAGVKVGAESKIVF